MRKHTCTHINAGRPEYIAASSIKKWLLTKQVRSTGLACHCELIQSCCAYTNAHAHAFTQMNMIGAAKIHEYKVKPLCIDGTHGFWCTETNTFVDQETSFSPPMMLRANLRLLAKVMYTCTCISTCTFHNEHTRVDMRSHTCTAIRTQIYTMNYSEPKHTCAPDTHRCFPCQSSRKCHTMVRTVKISTRTKTPCPRTQPLLWKRIIQDSRSTHPLANLHE